MKVAILGCGPTGLIAAKAARNLGADIAIFSKNRKSELFGAQYLHERIPSVDPGEPVIVNYTLQGTSEGYRRKVYGDLWSKETSADLYEGAAIAYDIRRAYDLLWSEFAPAINDFTVGPDSIGRLSDEFDLIISTVPADAICKGNHTFASQSVWAMGDAPERGQSVPFAQAADNTVICNGEPEPSWYRLSNIFGYKTVEWPQIGRKPPLPVGPVRKPLFNTCNCWAGRNIFRTGRYGQWAKGILAHETYAAVIDLAYGRKTVADSWWHSVECPYGHPELAEDTKRQLGCTCNG